ncbi:MAG: PAS domain-containing sensor histidine kinase [Pseudomonadota bacterium]
MKASILFRDGLTNRLRKELQTKTAHTDNHDRQLKHLIESTNVCPWNADLDQNCFTYIGPQISTMTGVLTKEWLVKGFLLEHVVPEDRKSLLNAFRNLRSGGFVTLEYRIRSSVGKIIWVRNSFCSADYGDNETQTTRKLQGFLTDITEQKNVEDALKTARYAAEKASKTKSNFLASMSHELRTPLNSIIGFAEIMRSQAFGALGQPQYVEYSENIHSSGKHLLDLINDILDYSKIEAGKFDVIKEPIDLRDIFRSCEILLRERAARQELALQIIPPQQSLMVNVDAKRIKQVLINLLTNSIKFTKSGGRVTLSHKVNEKNELIIYVIDTGIGIKPEDLGSVFEKFHQVDAERNRDQEGTGLGLSISKSLVEMHDGIFGLDSVYGHGTTVSITFPPQIIVDTTRHSGDASSIQNYQGDLPNVPNDDDDDDFISQLQSM